MTDSPIEKHLQAAIEKHHKQAGPDARPLPPGTTINHHPPNLNEEERPPAKDN